MTAVYPVAPGHFCVPTAIALITGAPMTAAIVPAINRHERSYGLHDPVAGVAVRTVGEAVLAELGYAVRAARNVGRRTVAWWAARSAARAWPHPLLVTIRGHALVIHAGRVYDSLVPLGVDGAAHPRVRSIVTYAKLVVPMKKGEPR